MTSLTLILSLEGILWPPVSVLWSLRCSRSLLWKPLVYNTNSAWGKDGFSLVLASTLNLLTVKKYFQPYLSDLKLLKVNSEMHALNSLQWDSAWRWKGLWGMLEYRWTPTCSCRHFLHFSSLLHFLLFTNSRCFLVTGSVTLLTFISNTVSDGDTNLKQTAPVCYCTAAAFTTVRHIKKDFSALTHIQSETHACTQAV